MGGLPAFEPPIDPLGFAGIREGGTGNLLPVESDSQSTGSDCQWHRKPLNQNGWVAFFLLKRR